MSAQPELHTDRLILRHPDPAVDLAEAFAIFSDPAAWAHAPELRHTEPETTRDWLARAAVRWDTEGLSYWVARLREGGTLVGVGGVQRQSTGAWNINYRLATDQRGHGYATELARAGLDAAAALDPKVPCIAWIRPINLASRAVAARLGLSDRGLRRDPSDAVARLAYADRPLADAYGAPVEPSASA